MFRTNRWVILLLVVLAMGVVSGCNLDVDSADSTDSDPDTPTAPPEPTVDCFESVQPGWIVYTVTRGDTLYDLARLYGTTVDEVVAANCLEDSSRIVIGDDIFLPSPVESEVEALEAYLFVPNVTGDDGRLAVCGGPVLEAIPRPATGTVTTDVQTMLDFVTRSYIRASVSGEDRLNPLYSQNLSVNSVRLQGDRIVIRLSGELQLVGACFDEQLEKQLVLTALHFPEVESAQIFVAGQNIKPLFDPNAALDSIYTRADVP